MKSWRFMIITLLLSVLLLQPCSFAGKKEFCKIAGKKVNVADIHLSTDFFPEKKYEIARADYTFSLDSNDLKIGMNLIDRYLNSSNSYKVMAGILVQYVNMVYPKEPCPEGKKACGKEVYLSVKNFFDYLNNNPGIKKKYLINSISRTMFAPSYKSLDYFLLQRTKEVSYAFYGISYLNSDALLTKNLMDKMITSILYEGWIPEVYP